MTASIPCPYDIRFFFSVSEVEFDVNALSACRCIIMFHAVIAGYMSHLCTLSTFFYPFLSYPKAYHEYCTLCLSWLIKVLKDNVTQNARQLSGLVKRLAFDLKST